MDNLPYRYRRACFMRIQKSLSLLILVIILIIGSVGCSRQEDGKNPGNAGGASEPGAKQLPQQRGQKTDETADWITYVSSKGRFFLRHPRYWAVGPTQPQNCTDKDSFFTAGAGPDLVAECGTEYFGQIYASSMEGGQLSSYKVTTSEYPYQNITSRKVTIDNIEGIRETGTARGQEDGRFPMPGLPDGTKVVIYLFTARGRNYLARYTQRTGNADRYFARLRPDGHQNAEIQ
jgi:hypothetical protein